MLHTIAIGRVTSKPAAGVWAIGALDPTRSGLIQLALDDRPDPWERVRQRADPEAVARTVAFVAYALTVPGV